MSEVPQVNTRTEEENAKIIDDYKWSQILGRLEAYAMDGKRADRRVIAGTLLKTMMELQ